jgi:L-Ala-D/L-Glu epimerase
VKAIRAARPDVWLGVDGNQGFVVGQIAKLVANLNEQRVSLLEQPLARGKEAELEGYKSPVPIAGDESLLTLDDVAGAVGRFDVVNIKLDKCGGLTEGLLMAAEARRLGLGVMIGNMVGSSLAMAPAFVLGQGCDIVDLDGPTFLAEDRTPSVVYKDGMITAGPEVWGSGRVTVA